MGATGNGRRHHHRRARQPPAAHRLATASSPGRGAAGGRRQRRCPARCMELSAIGEQVFAVESIRKKRVRKVGCGGAGSLGEGALHRDTPRPPCLARARRAGGVVGARVVLLPSSPARTAGRGRHLPLPGAGGRGTRVLARVALEVVGCFEGLRGGGSGTPGQGEGVGAERFQFLQSQCC